jgi:hypothetical protein
MIIHEHDRKTLEEFFEAIKFNLAGYKHASLSYFAVKNGDNFELSQGRLLLQCAPIAVPSEPFHTSNVRAGIYKLDELKQTPRGVVESLLSGKLSTPVGELIFPSHQDRPHSIYFNPSQTDGIQFQHRQMQLTIRGGRRQQIYSMNLGLELKAASRPFDNIQDLCNEYEVGQISGDEMSVEVVAFNVATVAADSSIKGTKACLAILLADGLEREKASLGYQIVEKSKVIKRDMAAGATIESWTTVGSYQRGEIKIDVPLGAVLHCIANYAGEPQHQARVTDPSVMQNPLRAVHQTFDRKLEILSDLINKSYVEGKNAKDRDARKFEVGIAWLFWMLGFAVTHLGDTPKTANAPDLIAVTPQGHFAVIECTTGLLKAENKLASLVERAEKVRQSLATSGHAQLRVLPIIITTKTCGEVMGELEQAQNSGVHVITREVLTDMLERSLVFPNADQFYAEAEEALRRGRTEATWEQNLYLKP